MSTTQVSAPAPVVASKSFVLKVKPDGAEKWKVLGYVSMREDMSGGVATLIQDDEPDDQYQEDRDRMRVGSIQRPHPQLDTAVGCSC